MDRFLKAAYNEAKLGFDENGIPIGAVLVKKGCISALGHNQRLQQGSAIHHAEMNCLENLGRKSAKFYKDCTLYTTLSPCQMCSGAILLYKIPHVVIGENLNFKGPEDYLEQSGINIECRGDFECYSILYDFIQANKKLWHEDIGE